MSDSKDEIVGSLPVNWGDNGVQTRAPVAVPTDAEIKRYSKQNAATCSSCKNFDWKHGQQEIAKQGFIAKLVHEYEWKVGFLGAPPGSMGLCKQSSDTLTPPHAPACDQYRPSSGGIVTSLFKSLRK